MDTLSKIKGFDLNLLAVFVAIDEHRNITQAAKTLSLTQPALSHALARLRNLLHDPLFVKTSAGMVPTPRAKELSEPIRNLLQAFEKDVLGREAFHPRNLSRAFRICSTDFIESLLFPPLLKRLSHEAPQVQLIGRPSSFSLPKQELEKGEFDLAIAGFFGELPDGFYQQSLFKSDFVSAVRKNHPRLGKKRELSLTEYCEEDHLLVAPGGELKSKVDELLNKKKTKRNTVAGLHSFMSSAWIISETDTLFTAPEKLVELIAKTFPLQVFTPPIEIPEINIVQVWHELNHQDSSHKWFREQVREILQKS